jgi:hypothetical protein
MSYAAITEAWGDGSPVDTRNRAFNPPDFHQSISGGDSYSESYGTYAATNQLQLQRPEFSRPPEDQHSAPGLPQPLASGHNEEYFMGHASVSPSSLQQRSPHMLLSQDDAMSSHQVSDDENMMMQHARLPRRGKRLATLKPHTSPHNGDECEDLHLHLRSCAECRARFLKPTTGVFWWLETRDACIFIGGLLLLTTLGILIKRS